MTWFPRTLAAGLAIAACVSLLEPSTPPISRTILPRPLASPSAPEAPDTATEGTEDPAIWFPDTEQSDHNESADGGDYATSDPRARDVHISNPDPGGLRGRQPGKAAGVYDAVGVGGGGRGGRTNRMLRAGPSNHATKSESVEAGLVWLARHQDVNGRWSCAGFDAARPGNGCGGEGYSEHDEGVTALAVLAFLHAGYSPSSRTEWRDSFGKSWHPGEVVKRGLAWLAGQQRPDGSIGLTKDDWFVIRHAAATWALCEAAGPAGNDALRQSARRAVDRLLEIQEPYSGWGDSGRTRKVDLVATAWALRALAAAENAGLAFPRHSREGIAEFLASRRVNRPFGALDATYWPDAGQIVVQGKNEDWQDHPLGAAVSLLAFPRFGKQTPEVDRLFANALVGDLPEYSGRKIDYHAWNFAASALASRRLDLPQHFAAFRAAALNALLPHQNTARDGCRCGSWEVDVDRWGFVGGRVYATALNVLTLLDLGN